MIKLVAILAFPVALSRLFQAVAGMIDIAMVGGLGAAATAAVGTGRQLIFISEMIMVSIISGAMAVAAQKSGQGSGAHVVSVLQHAFFLLLVTSLFLGAVGFLATPLLLTLIGAQGEVFKLGVDYMHVFFVGLWAMALSHIIANVMQASGDTLTPFFIIATINVLHVVANYVFINGLGPIPALGVRGAALGQISSRFVGLLIGLAIVYSGLYRINMRGHRLLTFNRDISWRIMRIGFPVTLQGLSRNGTSLVILAMISATQVATIGLASYAIGARLNQFAFFAASAFATVALILVGQSLGAGKDDEAETRGWVTLVLSLVVMTLIGLIFYFFAPTLVGFFTGDADVIAGSVSFVRMIAIVLPFVALSQVLAGALQGAGNTRPPLYYALIGNWLIALPLGYLLAFHFGLGIIGVWVAVIIGPVIQGLLVTVKYRRGNWKKHLVHA